MKQNKQALYTARNLDLFVSMARGIRGWILMIERTEEEIARGTESELREIMATNRLRLA